MATQNYVVTCLSPVHIGTGTQFSKLDGLYVNGNWCFIDLDKAVGRGLEANELATSMSSRDFSWNSFLRTKRINPTDIAAYKAPCAKDPGETNVRCCLMAIN
jgi:CRISPR/Cas system CSM-associated protein Csm5 (group 7 of RAMP superfamily)